MDLVAVGVTTSVVIVDDHALLRAGTAQILREAGGFEIVGEAADARAAMDAVMSTRPDAVLVDIRLPDANGIDLARRLIEACRDSSSEWQCKVIVLSAYDDDDYVQAAMDAGVAGYLLKTMPAGELVQAVRAACLGTTVLDPAVSRRLSRYGEPALARSSAAMTRKPGTLDRASGSYGLSGQHAGRTGTQAGPASPGTPWYAALTERERAVAELVVDGLANKEVARRLGISTRTVEGHLNHVFEKLGTRSRTALVRIALSGARGSGQDSGDAS